MPNDWQTSSGALTNTIGHAAGVLIFGIFLYLVFRQHSAVSIDFHRPNGSKSIGSTSTKDWLPLVAALLALLWNLASLMGLVLLGIVTNTSENIIAALGFSILSLLPAVLLQLCLDGRFPWLTRIGYTLSGFAVAAHIVELIHGDINLHRIGLSVITIGFGAVTVLAAAQALLAGSRWSAESQSVGEPPLTSRLLATMSLFLFAVSFIHFGDGHLNQAWSQELAFHHAGIPLALFVLMQEYRFVLIDAFIRFLANGLLAGIFGVLIMRSTIGWPFPAQAFVAALLVAAFALSREMLQTLLTRVVFRQPPRERVDLVMHALRAHYEDETAYLNDASQQIASLMGAPMMEIAAALPLSRKLLFPVRAGDFPELRGLQRRGVRAIVPIRLSVGDARYVLLGERRGGRPYLSEDLEPLARMAATAAEQLERIRAAETGRLVTEAELRALQAQIHPHFLFNALNTLYGIIPREAASARRTLLNLADIFRYFLRSEKAFVALQEEMRVVEAYLAIEAQRLGDKLRVDIEVDPALLREQIPVLSIQPLVENAVKHGVAANTRGGCVRICVRHEDPTVMLISVSDDGAGFGPTGDDLAPGRDMPGAGVGLRNVSRRLQLYYGKQAALSIESGVTGTTVGFRVPCGVNTPAVALAEESSSTTGVVR